MKITHKQLIEIGYKWLQSKCAFAFKEFVTINNTGEIPDLIGFNSMGTFILEAKTSRPDFFKDKEKHFRMIPELGMGDWRFFICKQGLIDISELPENWGLIEVDEKLKARCVYNPFGKGNIYSRWKKCEKWGYPEMSILHSALRRLNEKGLLENVYPHTDLR